MGKYEVSVITPLHNVSLDIFSRTVQSMRGQTFGFANIEWIVIVHNSPREYEEQILTMLERDKNVRVEILHDAVHSPSGPRNKGLEIATGDCYETTFVKHKFRQDIFLSVSTALATLLYGDWLPQVNGSPRILFVFRRGSLFIVPS